MDNDMATKIYVENIAPATTETELKELFSAYGNVAEVNIIVDRTHRKPRGFAFITMVTAEGARAAIQALHGSRLAESTLTVVEVKTSQPHAGVAKVAPKGAL
jgi:RNA recognition motif-containing protein